MPPNTTFTETMLIHAACELAEEQGIEALSARSVAARLSCSTAPIYSCFASIDELRTAVIARATELLREYTRRSYTERPFLNLGTGVVLFARERPQLFRLLFLTHDVAKQTLPQIHAALLADMRRDPRFAKHSAQDRKLILEQLWFIAVGMATLAYSGHLRENTGDAVAATLLDAGSALIPNALAKIASKRRGH